MATTPNYSIDYDDERFTAATQSIDQAAEEYNATVDGMINNVDQYYEDLQNQSQEWADAQAQIQQDNTDFAIEKIEQQKDQAQKDYLKEQSGAYVDWQKQSNQYGVEAEKMAQAGLKNTGFSESSQVSMYNTYQNRVATAREVMAQAKLNYDNNIKEAMLQNNAALAEIYANSYKEQLTLALEGFQYKNQLIIDQANKKIEFENTKWNRYQDILQQINTENALAEEVRQFNENQEWQTEQNQLNRDFEAAQAELDRTFQAEQNRINREFEAKENELNRKHDKEMQAARDKAEKERLAIQHKNEMAKLAQQQKNALAQLEKQLANDKALLKYENDLAKQNVVKVSKNSSGNTGNTRTKTPSFVSNIVKSMGFNGSSYKEAVAYLKKQGIDGSGAMTESEWSRRKNANSTAAEIKNYSSYSAYIKDYVTYKMGGK